MTEKGDLHKLVKAAQKSGAVYDEDSSGRHAKLVWPDGTHIVIPGSRLGSSKTLTSFRQRLRAKGVEV